MATGRGRQEARGKTPGGSRWRTGAAVPAGMPRGASFQAAAAPRHRRIRWKCGEWSTLFVICASPSLDCDGVTSSGTAPAIGIIFILNRCADFPFTTQQAFECICHRFSHGHVGLAPFCCTNRCFARCSGHSGNFFAVVVFSPRMYRAPQRCYRDLVIAATAFVGGPSCLASAGTITHNDPILRYEGREPYNCA